MRSACYNANFGRGRPVNLQIKREGKKVTMDFQPLAPYVSIIEIILGIVMIVLVLLQVKGSDLGGFMGGGTDLSGGVRTRRGIEATLHRLTIATAVAFFICTILAFLSWG